MGNGNKINKYDKLNSLRRHLSKIVFSSPDKFKDRQMATASFMRDIAWELRNKYRREDFAKAVERVAATWSAADRETLVAKHGWRDCSNILLGIHTVIMFQEG